MNGMLQSEWGVGTVAFWAYAVTVFSLSVLFTWVFNNTQRSILAVIMLHLMFNSTLNVLLPLSDRVTLFTAVILALVAVVVVAIWGAKTFSRDEVQSKQPGDKNPAR